MRKAFGLIILLAIGSSLGLQDDVAEADQARVISSLIHQFETVLYSRAHLLSSRNAASEYSTSAVQAPFGYLLGALDSLGKGASTEFLKHTEAVLLGAKDFRPPSGLGSVRSTSCYVMVLRKQSGLELHQYFSMSPKVTKAGRIWTWTAKLGEFGEQDPRNSSLFAIQVGQSYVVVCNDAGEIETLSEQLMSPAEYGPIHSIGFPLWSILLHDDLWCYRQYRRSGTLNKFAAGMKDVTPSAQALMLVVDFEKKVARLSLFASDDSTPEQINTSMMKANIGQPQLLRPSGSGMWEATIPLSSDQRIGELMFDIAGLFGFGIYL